MTLDMVKQSGNGGLRAVGLQRSRHPFRRHVDRWSFVVAVCFLCFGAAGSVLDPASAKEQVRRVIVTDREGRALVALEAYPDLSAENRKPRTMAESWEPIYWHPEEGASTRPYRLFIRERIGRGYAMVVGAGNRGGASLRIMEAKHALPRHRKLRAYFSSEDNPVTTVRFGDRPDTGYGLSVVVFRPKPEIVAELMSGVVQQLQLGAWEHAKPARELKLFVDDSDAFLEASARDPVRTGARKGQPSFRSLREECEDGRIVDFGVWVEGSGGRCAEFGDH